MKSEIVFNDANLIDGSFYAASNVNNEFYKFDESGVEKLFQFEQEPAVRDLFMQTVCVGERIILTPLSAGSIYIYDQKSDDLIKIAYEDRGVDNGKFHGCLLCGNVVYFLPLRYPEMIRLDLDDYSIAYIPVPYHRSGKAAAPQEPQFVYGCAEGDHLKVYRVLSDSLLDMNLKNGEVKEYRLPIGDCYIWGYFKQGDYEYVVSENGIFVLKKETVIFHQKDNQYVNGNYFFTACGNENRVVFAPFRRYHPTAIIIIEHTNDGQISVRFVNIRTTFHCIRQYGDKVYLLTNHAHTYFEYDVARDISRVILPGSRDEIVQESKPYPLSEWISLQLI